MVTYVSILGKNKIIQPFLCLTALTSVSIVKFYSNKKPNRQSHRNYNKNNIILKNKKNNNIYIMNTWDSHLTNVVQCTIKWVKRIYFLNVTVKLEVRNTHIIAYKVHPRDQISVLSSTSAWLGQSHNSGARKGAEECSAAHSCTRGSINEWINKFKASSEW